MKLIIGGFAQGKTEYVKKSFGDNNLCFFDAELPTDVVSDNKMAVINHFHEWVRNRLKEGGNPETEIKEFLVSFDGIFICDEIGNGIVPMDAFERLYRETTGRILIQIAKQADSVERVICGIGQRIK